MRDQISAAGWPRVNYLTRELDKAAVRIAELEAELHKYKLDAQHALDVLGHRVHELEAERDEMAQHANALSDRMRAAEAERDRLTAELAITEEASVRNGVALQREARGAEREACETIIRNTCTHDHAENIIGHIRARPAP